MSSGMPELGSKISLISKADIRYEGRLYTVDPQECTIALSSVRSFGTEDRETQYKIAPQSQIYDYILFRGSDIKDIRVVNNSLPHPNDPAIMQMQLPNGQHVMPHFPVSAHSSVTSNYGNLFRGMSGLSSMNADTSNAAANFPPSSNAASHYLLSQQSTQTHQQPKKNSVLEHQNQHTGSRSTTPVSLISRKSPTNEDIQGNVQKGLQKQIQEQIQQINQSQTNESNHDNNIRDGGYKMSNLRANATNQHINLQAGGGNSDLFKIQRDRRDLERNSENFVSRDFRTGFNYSHRGHGSAYSGPNRNTWNMHRNGQANQNFGKNRLTGGIGSGRNRPPHHQTFRSIGISDYQNKQRNPIKFAQDFDFEQANNKFEELRLQLTKLKVGDDTKSSEQPNAEPEKKDDSGNETVAGDHETEEEVTIGYDKTKSFFDNISCEAAQDRSKNKKTDWLQERKLNTETFGITSTRRGGFRPRAPNFYNRNAPFNMNGGNGFNRNYRGNNYRNNRNYQQPSAESAGTRNTNTSSNRNTTSSSSAPVTGANILKQLKGQNTLDDNSGIAST